MKRLLFVFTLLMLVILLPADTIVEVYSNVPIENASVEILDVTMTPIATKYLNLKKGWNTVSINDAFETGMMISNYKARVTGTNVGNETKISTSLNNFSYNTFKSIWEITDLELCYENKPLHNDWNWESFPKLTINTTTNNGLTNLIPKLTNNIHPSNYDFLLAAGSLGLLNYLDGLPWSPQSYDIKSSDSMKIKLDNPNNNSYYEATGTRVSPLTLINLQAGWNWVGYWLPHSQMSDVAFGATVWEKVKCMKSEDWFYTLLNNQRDGITPVSTTTKPLHYGEGYLVYITEPISRFTWSSSAKRSTNFDKMTPVNFAFEIKADYEAIDLVNLDSEISEIGVFEGDVCVGAVVVNSPNEQILAYTNDAKRNKAILSFDVIYGKSNSTVTKNYLVFDTAAGEFIKSNLVSGNQQYSIIMLTDNHNDGEQTDQDSEKTNR